MATRQRRAVDRDAYLHRLARALTCQRNERVGRVGGQRFATPRSTRIAEDATDMRLPPPAETLPGIRSQSPHDAERTVRNTAIMRIILNVPTLLLAYVV